MTASEIASSYSWNIILNRWGATWIDFIILFLFLLVPNMGLGEEMFRHTSGIWIGAIILYFPVCEGYNGVTLGKMATGIMVVDEDLNPPGLQKALIRTAFRLLEVNPLFFGGVPAGLFVLNSKQRQRLGDRFAQT
jgi:uncharacterized RDD family membrane protein YckC